MKKVKIIFHNSPSGVAVAIGDDILQAAKKPPIPAFNPRDAAATPPVKKDMDVICTICWDSLDSGRIYATTCGHIFHERCIVNWTMRSHCCPECRHEPTFPMRVIHFTWQELEAHEMQPSPDGQQDEANSSDQEHLPPVRKTVSTEDMFSCAGGEEEPERNTVEMAELTPPPPESSRASQQSIDGAELEGKRSEGCGVCGRFHYLLEKAIQLRNTIKEYEKAHRAGSSPPSPSASEQLKQALCSGPVAKRARQSRPPL
uniref:RING-type domain-containing protein n=1 Tax=Anopheles coluzzii TaxID=1518534 RepID=A0A6E8W9R8_ANOCL